MQEYAGTQGVYKQSHQHVHGDKERMPKRITKRKPVPKKKTNSSKKPARASSRKYKETRTPEQLAITNNDIDEYVAELLGYRLRKAELTKRIRDWSGVEWNISQIENFISGARTLLRAKLKISKEDYESKGIALCEAIISDPDAATRDKLRAHEQLIDILGLGAKWRINQDDPLDSAQEIIDFLKRARGVQTVVKKKD